MKGYLIIHFENMPSISLEIGEPTVRGFYRAIESIENAWSQMPGFVDSELITK